nr:Anti-sigma-F factor NrsF [uncultured bacterium]
MTDDLANRLAADLRPVPTYRLPLRLALGLAAGIMLAGALLLAWLRLRPDLASSVFDPVFWMKFGYTLLLAGGGFWAAERASRPGASARRPLLALLAVFVGCGAVGAAQLLLVPPTEMRTLVLGGSALLCPFYIVALSAPVFGAAILVMRRLAPTNLTLAGLAAGLLAGGAGAWIYAFHCTENGIPFIAIWYTLGVMIVATLGALSGRWLLRW